MTVQPRVSPSWAGFAASILWVGLLPSFAAHGNSVRPFQSIDSVELARFATHEGIGHSQPGVYSPDGRYYAAATTRARTRTNDLIGEIWLFDLKPLTPEQASTHLTPQVAGRRFLSLESDGVNGSYEDIFGSAVIKDIRWSDDARTLYFRATTRGESVHLFAAQIASGRYWMISGADQDVAAYDIKGDRLVYQSKAPCTDETPWRSAGADIPDESDGVGLSLIELLYPYWSRCGTWRTGAAQLWTVRLSNGRVASRSAVSTVSSSVNDYDRFITLSPHGWFAVLTRYATRIPASWENYRTGPNLTDGLQRDAADVSSVERDAIRQHWRAEEYALVDLKTGELTSLADAPLASTGTGWAKSLGAAWSPDDSQVALMNTYLRFDPENISASNELCPVATIAIADRSASCSRDVEPLGLRWIEGKGAPLVLAGKEDLGHLARLHDQTSPTQGDALRDSRENRLSVRVEQGLNDPPTLVAMDESTTHSAVLLDPNPQLTDIDAGRVESYRWKDDTGRTLSGALVLPPHFDKTHPYPLVIQTHGLDKHEFLTTGGYPTAQAARALAGRNILVLQVEEPRDAFGTAEEATLDGLNVYVSAIDDLVHEQMVEPSRIGLSGFSRTGLYVMTSLTKAPDRFAAAVLANGDPGDAWSYWSLVDYLSSFTDAERALYGGVSPYGNGLLDWFRDLPGFNTQKIRTPLLCVAGDPQHLLMTIWPIYAKLRDQRKPVDLQYFRGGQHLFTKPREQLSHQEMLVDWFDFWLNGHEDANSGKTAQYARWRILRNQRAILK